MMQTVSDDPLVLAVHGVVYSVCGIFYPHSVAVARYAALIRIKSPRDVFNYAGKISIYKRE